MFLREAGMKKITLAVAVLLLGFGASAYAAEVTGVLVDLACYTKDKRNTTNAHAGMSQTCAQDCASKGGTVAIVTKAGEVYEVMAMGAIAGENNAKLVPHMSHTVTLTGEIAEPAAGSKTKNKVVHATELKMVSR